MHISRTETASIAAPPATVLAYVADPVNLPAWAPDFADSVRLDGDRCQVARAGATFPIRVRTSTDHGTVDLLAADDPTRGAFTRVVPNGPASEYCFTLFFPPETDPAAIDAQMAIVRAELARVRDACEG